MDQIKKEAPLKVAFKIVARTHNENWPAKYARGTVDFLVKALKDYFTDELDGSLFTASYHKESDAFVYVTYPTIKTAIEFVASTSITISNEDGSGYKIKYEPKLDLTITTRTNETYLYGWVYTSGIPCSVTTLEKPLAAWLRNVNLTLRNNSITQKKDREEDTNYSEFRFEFDSPENPNANSFLRKNQIILNGGTATIKIGEDYMNAMGLHYSCARFHHDFIAKSGHRVSPHIICNCEEEKARSEKARDEAKNKRAAEKGYRARKAARMTVDPFA